MDLKIKESPYRGVYVEGLSEECVGSPEELYHLLDEGNGNRRINATSLDHTSSRSHTLFILEINQKLSNGIEKRGLLNLVDLAGSEKTCKSKC